MEVLNHKVSRIRFDAASVAASEEGRPFSEAELQQLAGMKQRRMADLAWRQGTAILRAVMAHKVGAGRLAVLGWRRYMLWAVVASKARRERHALPVSIVMRPRQRHNLDL